MPEEYKVKKELFERGEGQEEFLPEGEVPGSLEVLRAEFEARRAEERRLVEEKARQDLARVTEAGGGQAEQQVATEAGVELRTGAAAAERKFEENWRQATAEKSVEDRMGPKAIPPAQSKAEVRENEAIADPTLKAEWRIQTEQAPTTVVTRETSIARNGSGRVFGEVPEKKREAVSAKIPESLPETASELTFKKEKAEFAARVSDLVDPRGKRRELADLVDREFFKGEKSFEHREAELQKFGYNAALLRESGELIVADMKTLSEKNPKDLIPEEQKRLERYRGLIEAGDKDNLTIGLMSELSRQARKLMKASLEKNVDQWREVLKQDNVDVNEEEVDRFIETRNADQGSFIKNQDGVLGTINNPSKRNQYSRLRQFLNVQSLRPEVLSETVTPEHPDQLGNKINVTEAKAAATPETKPETIKTAFEEPLPEKPEPLKSVQNRQSEKPQEIKKQRRRSLIEKFGYALGRFIDHVLERWRMKITFQEQIKIAYSRQFSSWHQRQLREAVQRESALAREAGQFKKELMDHDRRFKALHERAGGMLSPNVKEEAARERLALEQKIKGDEEAIRRARADQVFAKERWRKYEQRLGEITGEARERLSKNMKPYEEARTGLEAKHQDIEADIKRYASRRDGYQTRLATLEQKGAQVAAGFERTYFSEQKERAQRGLGLRERILTNALRDQRGVQSQISELDHRAAPYQDSLRYLDRIAPVRKIATKE